MPPRACKSNSSINSHSQNFMVNITPFDGDADTLDHFFSQIRQLEAINKWSEQQTAIFLKSKLTGNALQYLLDSPSIRDSQDVKQIHDQFKTFFGNTEESTSIFDFEAIRLNPDESIRNFAHRLNVVTSRVYKDLSDNAMSKIKFTKFMASLPSNIRLSLLQTEISDYSAAVEKAQKLQNQLNKDKVLINANSDSVVNTLSCELLQLRAELENLKKNTQDKENQSIHHIDTHAKSSRYKSRNTFQRNTNFSYPRRQNFQDNRVSKNNYRNQAPRRHIVVCQLCDKRGHEAKNCFSLQNFQEFQRNTRNSNRLNPSTRPFVPKKHPNDQ